MKSIRETNFKIGCFHGKIDPGSNSEAKIRNDMLSGRHGSNRGEQK